MNILIKLTCLIGLVIAPMLGGHSLENHGQDVDDSKNKIELSVNEEIN